MTAIRRGSRRPARGERSPGAPGSAPVRSRLVPTRARRARRLVHRLRAARHHVAAVLREFRAPLLAFGLVTVGGGFAYGELYRLARGEVIPLIDRPYVVLQLMLLEAPEAVPPEWYLAAFWYALPVVFVVLLALGAADFVDLFFNRGSDRDRWAEALAMTYRNHAIVFGAGHVGLRVVRDLVDLGLEVVVIDQHASPEVLETLDRLGVPVVAGDGRRTTTLETAGLGFAEVFVACTGDDRVNLEAVMQARELDPDVRIVSRVWSPSYAHKMRSFMDVQAVLSAADLSAPAFAGAAVGVEITQTLEIAGEEYSTIRLSVGPGSFLAGRTVGELEEAEGVEIVLRRRGEDLIVDPAPGVDVAAGDDLVVFARHGRVLDVVARNRRPGRDAG